MIEVHLHPDEHLIIRDNDEVVYSATLEEFEADFGQALEALSSPWTERIYALSGPNVAMNRLANRFTNETSMDRWTQGDAIVTNKNALIQAKATRLAAIEAAKETEEAARIASLGQGSGPIDPQE